MAPEKAADYEPMSDAQRDYLQKLSEKTGETFDPNLTKSAASKMIEALKIKARDKRNNVKKTVGKPEREKSSTRSSIPMTDAQRAFLEDLCIKTGEDFDPRWSKFEASKKISELKRRL